MSLASSRGGLRMKRRGGTFFLGKATFLRSASSLRRRWGLLGGASCGVLVATAKARRRGIGRREWGNLRWDWRGAGEREEEKERSKEGRRWREEESSICVRERGLSGHQWRSFGGLQRGVGRREIRGGEEEIDVCLIERLQPFDSLIKILFFPLSYTRKYLMVKGSIEGNKFLSVLNFSLPNDLVL